MINKYFTGAKNVIIIFKSCKQFELTDFIYHCDNLFGWISQYYKKPGSNKLYAIFPTLTRGEEFFDKIEHEEIVIPFPNNVFNDNVSHNVIIRGYYGHSEQDPYLKLPSSINYQYIFERLTHLENNDKEKTNNLVNTQEYINLQISKFNEQNTANCQAEIEELKNKMKILKDENYNQQLVIRQQTTVKTLLLEKIIRMENDFNNLNKWTDLTQNLVCENTNKINMIKSELQENQINSNNIVKMQKEIYDLQNSTNITENSMNSSKSKIEEINQYLFSKNQSFELDIAKINENILNLKEHHNWSEKISLKQHQYALQKFNCFENRINQLEKKDKSNEMKINQIENIKHLTQNLISLDNLDFEKISEPIQILDNTILKNDYDCKVSENKLCENIDIDEYYGEDDENMFVIIRENYK